MSDGETYGMEDCPDELITFDDLVSMSREEAIKRHTSEPFWRMRRTMVEFRQCMNLYDGLKPGDLITMCEPYRDRGPWICVGQAHTFGGEYRFVNGLGDVLYLSPADVVLCTTCISKIEDSQEEG